jgi:hypothetical protein
LIILGMRGGKGAFDALQAFGDVSQLRRCPTAGGLAALGRAASANRTRIESWKTRLSA